MRAVILFGGDGGGLLISDKGVRPIPPFDPSIRLKLRSTSALVKALVLTEEGSVKTKKAKLAASLSNLAVSKLKKRSDNSRVIEL